MTTFWLPDIFILRGARPRNGDLIKLSVKQSGELNMKEVGEVFPFSGTVCQKYLKYF
jgi:hypothetical protein